MSISASLSNALSGLTAASRAAQLVSSNVANSMTEGYARRELDLSVRNITGAGDGVQIDGVRRVVDETLLRDRRLSDAALAQTDVRANYAAKVMDLLGVADEPGSLSASVAALQGALIEAVSRPDSDARLSSVLQAAQTLAAKLNAASDGIQQQREDADAGISAEVIRLNTTLSQIVDLNAMILRTGISGNDVTGLLDQRQRLIDEVSGIVPVREIPRDNGTVALYSLNGALLVDGKAAVFGFARTEPITADMTLASGALGGLTINGQPIATGSDQSPVAGGRLGALFEVRDRIAIADQAALDALAADLIQRFESPGIDLTAAAGDPGLFTDLGAALDLGDTV